MSWFEMRGFFPLGIILLLITRNGRSVTCIPGSTSAALFTTSCTFATSIGSLVENMKIGPISYNLYEGGQISYAASTASFIRKLGRDNTVIYTNTYSNTISGIGGFDIDYTETYIYALLSSASVSGFIRFKTLDGAFDIAYTQTGIGMSDAALKYPLTLSSSSQTAFFSAIDGSLNGYLGRWQDPSTNVDCIQYASCPPPNSISFLSGSIVYINYLNSAMNVFFAKVDFSQVVNTQIWVSQITSGSGNAYSQSVIKYDATSSTIYTLCNTYHS